MKQTSKTIVFFGSGPVAAASLESLLNEFTIELVVTKHKPTHHKDPAPVEELAKKHGLQLAYADSKHELDTVIDTLNPASTCGVVIDYGVIISQHVIDYFSLGIVNSHFSLLPEWRGADPITFSLLSGQADTGVSLMIIDEGLDTGAIIAETPVAISSHDTGESLTQKLIDASNAQLAAILPLYIDGAAVGVPQDTHERIASYSRKLTKQDGYIDVLKPASALEREIRAFSEWPKSKLVINDSLTVIITKAQVLSQQLAPGELVITDAKELLLGTRVGSLSIIELMPLGKQKMSAAAFLNGYGARIAQG